MSSSNYNGGTLESCLNNILGTLTKTTCASLSLEAVKLQTGMILHEPDSEIEHAYFPEKGLVSIQSMSHEGHGIEIGVVGYEGMVGLPAVLGGYFPYRAVVQIDGEAWRTERTILTDEFQRNRQLHDVLLRYTNRFLVQVAQSSVCNCFHNLYERLSRWLLMTHDAIHSDRIRITHDVIAQVLGTRRASVTVTAGLLQKAGYIQISRGFLTILNRPGLESVSCECYQVVRESSRLLAG